MQGTLKTNTFSQAFFKKKMGITFGKKIKWGVGVGWGGGCYKEPTKTLTF
jgi:hypothetical protein